jgi:V/A-type H+-transporting ATPase subunit E
MSEELQGLLNRIQEEGIAKADKERSTILAAAKAEAAKITTEARRAAEDIIRQAREDADNTVERGKIALGQAARDILIQLRNEMTARMTKVVKNNMGEVMTPEFMTGIISEMTAQYLRSAPGADLKLEVMVAPGDLARMQALLANSVGASFKGQPKVLESRDIESGLQVSVKDGDVFFDFSDEALTEVICGYAGPRFAEYFNR